MRYEIEFQCRGENPRLEIVIAENDKEAESKAKAWARSLAIPLEDCWLVVKNADGRFKTYKGAEI